MLNGIMETLAVNKVAEAYKRSQKDGKLRHIVAKVSEGYKIVLHKPRDAHFWTNGVEVGTWIKGVNTWPEASPELLAEIENLA